jgi:hypothetical protein
MVRKDKLDEGRIEALVGSLRSLAASHPELAEQIRTEANYFESNQERMRYPEFRKRGLFVGSGVIEAGCKTVLGRLKQSGMFWTVRGAQCHYRPPLLSAEWPVRGLLGVPSGAGLTLKSRTQWV